MKALGSTHLLLKILKIKAWKELVDTNMHVYLLTILYVILVTQSFSYFMIPKILVLIGLLATIVSFAFLWNDYCDMPTDIKAGKKRVIHEIPDAVVLGVIALVFSASFVLVALFVRNLAFILVYTFAYFLAVSYSAPPLRFKDRGWLGVILDAVGEKAVPVLSVFAYFDRFSYDTLLCVLIFSIFQLKMILDHQVFDYEADAASGTNTLVVRIGVEKAEAILRFLRPIFASMYSLFMIALYLQVPSSLMVLVLMFLGYLILKILVTRGVVSRANVRSDVGRWVERIPLYDGYISASLGVLLLLLAVLTTLTYPPYAYLLALAVASQFYIIKGHYLRVANDVLRLIFQRP